jgi:hypothetical protein
VLSPYISGHDCSESSCMRRVVSCLCTLNGFGTLVSAVSGSILSYRRPNYWSGGGLLIKNTVTCAIDRVEYASIWANQQGLQTVRPPCRLSESRTCSDLFLVSFTRDTPIAGPKPGTVSTDTAHDLTLRARQLRESESAAHFSR